MTVPVGAGEQVDEAGLLADDLRAALADDIDLLVRLHDREPDAALLGALRGAPVDCWFSLRLGGRDFEEAARLMTLALASIPDPPDASALDDLAAEFAAVYLTFHYRAAPAQSVWLDEDGLERQQAMFACRRWYRRFGVEVPDWRRRSDDHLVHQLQLLALALRDLANPQALRLMAAFMREHPLTWVPGFAARVAARCHHPFFAAGALLTAVYLGQLAALLASLLQQDMAPIVSAQVPPGRPAAPSAPTCADLPSSAYLPGGGPGW